MDIAAQLKCTKFEASAAIQRLIATGKRHAQKDGIVYDAEGKVVAIDPDRTLSD